MGFFARVPGRELHAYPAFANSASKSCRRLNHDGSMIFLQGSGDFFPPFGDFSRTKKGKGEVYASLLALSFFTSFQRCTKNDSLPTSVIKSVVESCKSIWHNSCFRSLDSCPDWKDLLIIISIWSTHFISSIPSLPPSSMFLNDSPTQNRMESCGDLSSEAFDLNL